MRNLMFATLLLGSLAASAQPSLAQRQPERSTPDRFAQLGAPAFQPDPNLNAEDQFAPSQLKQKMPAAVPEPGTAPGGTENHQTKHVATAPPAEPRAANPKRAASFRTVACNGPFAKDSSNLMLAMVFDSRNVTFTDVNGGSAGDVMASVVFPKDPKRRLEVWWTNPAARSGIYLVVINGQSTWAAPGGLRLGLTLPQLEKLNRKPFELNGFNKNGAITVSDWKGGALAAFPGGCKANVSLRAAPNIPAEAIATFPADHTYSSADPALRATRPTIAEILIGY